jgi:diguanylate cyclase (GGDEF)-like protein
MMTKASTTTVLQGREAFDAALGALGPHVAVAVALCDLDEFSPLNDRHGRDAADTVLRSVERTLTGSLPAGAIVARIGGDEYGVALVDTTAENTLILLEEVRAHISSQPASDAVPDHISVSIGVAARPPHAEDPAGLYAAAQQALYRAKREGGDRVAIHVEERMVLKSNYYPRAALDRLAKLSARTGRTEASLLREALDDVLERYRD